LRKMTSTMDPQTLKRYVLYGRGKKLEKKEVMNMIDLFFN